jgi:transcriptional regulator with XRE-family HTH domain
MKGGQLIREARRRAGLTQSELARRAATTQSAVARWEANEVSPSLEKLVEVIRACGFDVEVALVPYDDHDWTLAQGSLLLTPEQRVDGLVHFVDVVDEARRFVARD